MAVTAKPYGGEEAKNGERSGRAKKKKVKVSVTNSRGAQNDDDRSPLSAVKGNQLAV